MRLLPFEELPRYRNRQFVPANIDLGDWSQIAPLFEKLESRAPACRTSAELEKWLLDSFELSAALDEESSKRYIAMTCHTENADAEKAFLHFVEQIEPQLKPLQFKLAKIYLEHPLRSSLPKSRYEVFDRNTQLQVELFRPENVPLETEEAKLGQQYQKLIGSLTVQFKGSEQTLVQMGRYLEEPDRELREEAWKLSAGRRLKECEPIEQQFEGLLKIREKVAANAGFPDYLQYAFRARGRFDYGPGECIRFHEAIETEVMPLLCELQRERKRQLGVDKLRPWDLSVDPLNLPPLKPFQKASEMVDRCERIFRQVDPELGAEFAEMNRLKLLDLENRKGKAPGGYQSTLSESRLPFIFMNSIGVQRDVETLLHEAGHAFHALAAKRDDFYPYRNAPIEFCEVASMSMELLGSDYLHEFYQKPEANRARRDHLEGIIEIFPWIATVDAFQHWIYSHPGHTASERQKAWLNLMDRFGGLVDWSGFEQERANLWHRQLHIFLHPFYYVEYGIAQLGALQVWANSKRNAKEAVLAYRRGLALGGSRPLPELFAAAGCKFDFSRESVAPLIQLVSETLKKSG